MDVVQKLRYQGRQYAAGQSARGGGITKHWLEDAADELESLRADTERLRKNQRCAALEGAETGSPCNTYKMLEAQKDAEIEELRAHNKQLREALQELRYACTDKALAMADAALAAKGE